MHKNLLNFFLSWLFFFCRRYEIIVKSSKGSIFEEKSKYKRFWSRKLIATFPKKLFRQDYRNRRLNSDFQGGGHGAAYKRPVGGMWWWQNVLYHDSYQCCPLVVKLHSSFAYCHEGRLGSSVLCFRTTSESPVILNKSFSNFKKAIQLIIVLVN